MFGEGTARLAYLAGYAARYQDVPAQSTVTPTDRSQNV